MKFPVHPFQPSPGKQTGKMRMWKDPYVATLYSGNLLCPPVFLNAKCILKCRLHTSFL